MISIWDHFYLAMRIASNSAMFALDFWCFAGVIRMVRRQGRYYDPLRGAVAWLASAVLWFFLRSWIYGQHGRRDFSIEGAWYVSGCAAVIVACHVIYSTIRLYEKTRDTAR
jgi:hypothetical protein